MTFEELIEAGRRAESLEDVGGLWDELMAVNGQTMEGYTARTGELEAKIAELEGEMTRLMAENYKLMTAAAEGDKDAEEDAEEDIVDEEDDAEDDVDSIADYIED